MSTKTHCLSTDEMHVFLDGELPEAEDSSVIEHLDGCPKCRAALEESAGGQQWLGRVMEFLADADSEFATEKSGEETELASEPFLIADRLTFLAPSEDPRM